MDMHKVHSHQQVRYIGLSLSQAWIGRDGWMDWAVK